MIGLKGHVFSTNWLPIMESDSSIGQSQNCILNEAVVNFNIITTKTSTKSQKPGRNFKQNHKIWNFPKFSPAFCPFKDPRKK